MHFYIYNIGRKHFFLLVFISTCRRQQQTNSAYSSGKQKKAESFVFHKKRQLPEGLFSKLRFLMHKKAVIESGRVGKNDVLLSAYIDVYIYRNLGSYKFT